MFCSSVSYILGAPSTVSTPNIVSCLSCSLTSNSNSFITRAKHEINYVTETGALAFTLFRANSEKSRSSSTRPFTACARHLCRICDRLSLLQCLRAGLGTIMDLSETEAAPLRRQSCVRITTRRTRVLPPRVAQTTDAFSGRRRNRIVFFR